MHSMPREQGETPNKNIPFAERPSCTVQEAIQATGLSRTTLYEKIAAAELISKTVGRRRLINVPSLLALVGGDTPQESSNDS
jgi:excisionase family DNA binding protein